MLSTMFSAVLRAGLGLLAVVAIVKISATDATSAEPAVHLLWPEGAPGATGDDDTDKPRLTVYLADPAKATGSAIVVVPGGGYGGLAMGHEGTEIAQWLTSHGISAFILQYRLGSHGYRHPIPLTDAQRAIRTVRANAEKWKIDPKRVGIIGFSAGGHLASTAGTKFDAGDASAKDPIDRVSSRPDIMILGYPVISLNSDFTHVGSRDNLLGPNPDKQLVASLSNETQVTVETPPTFLLHTGEDTAVPPENSIVFYQALRKAGVPVEMHIYQTGVHGIGLAAKDPILSSWPDRCIAWLQLQGFLEKK